MSVLRNGERVSSPPAPLNMQFKLLSAIGIILIVSGHCYSGGISLGYEWFPIYSFNLSLFVFISGYFYKPKDENNVISYCYRRFRRLVIPAYFWNIAYGLFILLTERFGYTIGSPVDLYHLFVMPFVDGEAFRYNLGSWFVYPLFLVCVVNILFRKLTGILRIRSEYLILAVYLLIGMLGIRLAIGGENTGIMKLLTRSMFFLPIFQLGILYRSRWEAKDQLNSIVYFAVLFAVQLVLLTFCQDLRYYPSVMSGFQNGVVIPYITSVTGIAFWLRVARLLAPTVTKHRSVRLIADNTYSIMIHQMTGFMTVKWLFYLISCITPLFSDFDPALMRSSVWYYYLPNQLQQYGIVYLAGGILLPVAIKKLTGLILRALANGIRRIVPKKAV